MAKVFNIQTAKQMGYSDEEIAAYLAKSPGIGVKVPPAQTEQPKKENLLASLLPLLGGIAGTALGTPLGPAGMIAGGAIGSGLGETGRQGLSGKPLQGGKIAGEAVLGGLGGGLGTLLKGTRFAGTAAKAIGGADEAGNILTKAGRGFRASVTNPQVAVGPTMASGEKAILSSATKFGLKGSAKAQLQQVDEIAKGLYDGLDDVVKASTNKINAETIRKQFTDTLAKQGFVGESYQNFNKAFLSRIPKGEVDAGFLTSFKRTLGTEMANAFKKQLKGGALSPREEVGLSLWKALDDAIIKIEPSAKDITMQLSELHNIAPGLAKQAAERYTWFGAKVPKDATQALKDLTGRGLEKAGRATEAIGKRPLLSAGAGQLPTQMFRGGGEIPEGYTSPVSAATGTEGYTQPKTGLSRITAEDVALARLVLPDKQADALEAAYKLMGGDEKESANVQKRQLILNQASPVIERITESALKAPTGMGGALAGLLGGIPGVAGGEAEFLKRDTEAFARLIASAFASEVGVATDRDVKRWMSMMPQTGDTANERRRQIEKMVGQIIAESEALGMEVPPSVINVINMLQ
jgi:hypothetical protein